MTVIQRIKGQSGAPYEILFVDQHGRLIVALTEWYRLRSTLGPASTRDTYLSHTSVPGSEDMFSALVSKEDSKMMRHLWQTSKLYL